MKKNSGKNRNVTSLTNEVLEYQPDAVEIEERGVSGKIRWVLYLIIGSLVLFVAGAVIFKVDRIVVAQGRLITTMPTIVVQPLTTAIIRSIDVRLGDIVEKDQTLVSLDATFVNADLTQLTNQSVALRTQLRRIRAEIEKQPFAGEPDEGDDGRLQEQIFRQRKLVFQRTKQKIDDRIAALQAKLHLSAVQRAGQTQQLKLLRDLEGTTAKLPQTGDEYRIRLLDAQKARFQVASAIDNLEAEEAVTLQEIKEAKSDWQRFIAERDGELMEQEVVLRNQLGKVQEEITKASRMNELVSLRAPEKAIVLKMADRSVGSIIQQAEPFITLIPYNSAIEAEVDIEPKDIGRIRPGDLVRVKLDAFPFQRHDTLQGSVRVISEAAHQRDQAGPVKSQGGGEMPPSSGFYHTRIELQSTVLRNVPEGFRLMPGMKVRAEIKVGKRSVISYFLYPIIRALDESLREP